MYAAFLNAALVLCLTYEYKCLPSHNYIIARPYRLLLFICCRGYTEHRTVACLLKDDWKEAAAASVGFCPDIWLESDWRKLRNTSGAKVGLCT